jgi:predicted porin
MKFKYVPLSTLAVAVLACCNTVQAQNSMTFYGTIDAGVLNLSSTSASPAGYVPSAADGGKFSGFKDGGIGGSNLGIKGERNMGNGNKAYVQLQGNINTKDGVTGGATSTGASANFNQMALLGLSGNAGDIKLGRQVSPMYFAMASTDARGARYFGSTLTTLVGMNSASGAWIANNNAMFGTVYNDNSVVYTLPRMANTSVSIQHAFGNTNGSSSANAQDAVTAVYSDGGLRVSGLYYNGKGNGLANATTLTGSAAAAAKFGFSTTANTNRLTSIGVLYTSGPWTMSAATFEGKNSAEAKLPVGSTHMGATALGLGYKLAADLNLSGGYYTLKDKLNVGNKASQTAISLDYTLFKDTTGYIQVANTSNTGANMNLSPIFGSIPAANKNNSATMIGARYTF